MAILPHKCFASFLQGYFGEYMAILKGCLLAILIKGCPENQMAMLPWHFFAIFMQVCFGEFTATYLDGKKYMYWLPGKVFASFMQGHFESISQHCQVMFWQCLCNIPQRAYENIAMLVFCKLYARSFRWVYGNIEGLPSSNLNLRLPKKTNDNVAMPSFCNLYASLFWRVHGNLLRYQELHLLIAREDFWILYARSFRKHFRNIAKLSFGNVYARLPKEDMAILSGKCFASFMQGHFGEYMATLKGGLPASFIKGVPKGKWLCCHATFLQSLCKFALASTWQPTQIPKTAFIGCQARCLGPLCKVVKKVFRNIARWSFRNPFARSHGRAYGNVVR